MSKLVRHVLGSALCAALVVFVAACSSSEERAREKRRSYVSTSSRPEPPPSVRSVTKAKWTEPTEAIERKPLKLRRGGTAHLAVTATTFDASGLVADFRDDLTEALQELDVFNQVNVSGNQGHFALDILIVDTRTEDGVLFFSGGQRFKVGLTVTDTRTKRRLSPKDPNNLFYGSRKEVIAQITAYLAS
jgi:hypothetical protein